MKKAAFCAYLPIALAAIVLLWAAASYNALLRSDQAVKQQWAQVENQLQRRSDLIPNYVRVVQGYAKHERETLENVIKARSACMSATGPAETAKAENFLSQTLKSLFAVVEAYPDLKANQNFMALQEELTSTENKVSFARQFYNDTVMRYNTKIQTVPSNIIAGMFSFKAEEFFEVEAPAERQAPKVQF